jgi:hypothetical protein
MAFLASLCSPSLCSRRRQIDLCSSRGDHGNGLSRGPPWPSTQPHTYTYAGAQVSEQDQQYQNCSAAHTHTTTMIILETKATKAERHTQPTQRKSRHSLRKIYNSLTASVRSSPGQSTDFFMEAEDHTRWLPQHPIAGDVYATHPELIESPHPRSASPANASHNGRGFLRHKRHSQVPTSRSPAASTASTTPSVIFITCSAR